VELLKAIEHDDKNSVPVLIDQGEDDNFLAEQLNTQLLVDTARDVGYAMQVRFQPGYDHSYFFIASFIEEHIDFHAKFVCK
jgi:S-formylglutathione hydrolase